MADIYLYGGAASLNDIILRDPTTVAVVVIPQAPATQGGGGTGGGGARWERSSGQSGKVPALSVKQQNAKERRELLEIAEREAANEAADAQIAAYAAQEQRAALEEIKALVAETKLATEKAASIAAAQKVLADREAALQKVLAEHEAELVLAKAKLDAEYEDEALILLLAAA